MKMSKSSMFPVISLVKFRHQLGGSASKKYGVSFLAYLGGWPIKMPALSGRDEDYQFHQRPGCYSKDTWTPESVAHPETTPSATGKQVCTAATQSVPSRDRAGRSFWWWVAGLWRAGVFCWLTPIHRTVFVCLFSELCNPLLSQFFLFQEYDIDFPRAFSV